MDSLRNIKDKFVEVIRIIDSDNKFSHFRENIFGNHEMLVSQPIPNQTQDTDPQLKSCVWHNITKHLPNLNINADFVWANQGIFKATDEHGKYIQRRDKCGMSDEKSIMLFPILIYAYW